MTAPIADAIQDAVSVIGELVRLQSVEADYRWLLANFTDVENPGIGDEWRYYIAMKEYRSYDSLDALVHAERERKG